jgi:hypothetical protein
VIKGKFKNNSQLKTKLPGLLPSVVCTPALIACVAMESASSTNSFAVVIFCGGSPCKNVLITLPTVWCILSHTALDCGLFFFFPNLTFNFLAGAKNGQRISAS